MQSNKFKYDTLRESYPFFVYDHYEYDISQNVLLVKFFFNISNEFFFNTKLSIVMRPFYYFHELNRSQLDNLIFHIGMIELISYWKVTCSPKIYIKPHHLTCEQIKWWKKLYFHGLGEFFYCNGIDDVTVDNFMEIYASEGSQLCSDLYTLNDGVIVPIGGGKDSIVTLESMKKYSQPKFPMIINPRQASLDTTRIAGFSRTDIVEVQRTLDCQLIQLNEKGFLNGHTPFSAVLAFITLLISAGTKAKHIALSNESSANEATVKNSSINHQYSKSIEFERDFRFYVSQYISSSFNYFSFLRPLTELTIAMLFAKLPTYFTIFKSCNKGSKNDIWCCQCAKCLFTYVILSPFISPRQLKEIFGENLLNKPALQLEYEQLIGLHNNKPFECVGTVTEINMALTMSLANYTDERPYLLRHFEAKILSKVPSTAVEKEFHYEHFLTEDFEQILKCNLY